METYNSLLAEFNAVSPPEDIQLHVFSVLFSLKFCQMNSKTTVIVERCIISSEKTS